MLERGRRWSARSRLGAALWLLGWAAAVDARSLRGEVFLDHNGDGRRQHGEPGVAGVKLSNGRQLAISDANGHYRIELADGDTLFLIKPPGYALPRGDDGLPRFWQHQRRQPSQGLRYGGLPRARADGRFALLSAAPDAAAASELLLFGDPQPKTLTEVGYFERDIVAPLIGRQRAVLGVSLGDIVHDDLTLYAPLIQVMSRLQLPWLHVPGNHDVDFDAADDAGSLDSFRAHFGPDSFAYETETFSFIGLDDVIYLPGQRPEYVGGLRESQFEFLANYLPTLPRDRLLLLGMHIHLFDAYPWRQDFRRADRDRLFQLLREFPHLLIVTAHSHAQRHVFYRAEDGWHGARPLHEYNVGTACGGYWGGEADAAGIPDASMADGTPNGYARLQIDGAAEYRLFWEVARAADDPGIRLFGPQVLRQGAWPGVGLYANVYMGMDDSVVELRIDGGPWRPMRRLPLPDRWVLAHNLRDDLSDHRRGFDRLPEAEVSTHQWRFNLPTDLALGEHLIEVRSVDRWRGELRAQTRYRLESP